MQKASNYQPRNNKLQRRAVTASHCGNHSCNSFITIVSTQYGLMHCTKHKYLSNHVYKMMTHKIVTHSIKKHY
jgi:hypothetical protein